MEKLGKSIGWATTEELCTKLCGLGSTLGLTIWLSPDDFAISAMAVLFVALARVLVDSGFGEAIVRIDSVEQNGLSSIFWINVVIGSILYVALWLLAPILSSFYSEPKLIGGFQVVMLSAFFHSLYVVDSANFGFPDRNFGLRT